MLITPAYAQAAAGGDANSMLMSLLPFAQGAVDQILRRTARGRWQVRVGGPQAREPVVQRIAVAHMGDCFGRHPHCAGKRVRR
ncbi:MAG: hypothetical protein ACRCSO_05860 [Sphingomonas sp.]